MPATATADPAVASSPEQNTAASDRERQIEANARTAYQALQRVEQRKPPEERADRTTLWNQARRQAIRGYRRKVVKDRTKQTVRRVATTAYAESRSTLHRNRSQLAPWLLSVPYAVTGEAWWALSELSNHPVALSAAAAATAAGASVLAWRTKLAKRVPGKFRAKLQAALGLLCGWTSVMPLVDGGTQAGMWLALMAGVSYMGLSWWREHEHPVPVTTNQALATPEAEASQSVVDDGPDWAFAKQVVSDWGEFVTGMDTLPGSTLSILKPIEYGWQFRLDLNRGKQRLETVRAAKPDIAAALDVDAKDLSIDRDTRPGAAKTTLVLTVITAEISNAYDGPRILREGGDVYIEIGPYEDGIGAERFQVLADQLSDEALAAGQRPAGSMNGGFVLGTKGSGKSRLIELIAVGLRALGIEIWYLDPQGGKSSPALMAEADWPLAGMHGTKGAYSNVSDLRNAVSAACEVRENEGGDVEQGFQHTRQRPAIMVIIDECHAVFQAEDPDTEDSFGEQFADLDRIMRKNGVGLLGASQGITQDTFGRGNKAAVLRDGMCAANVFPMSYGGRNLKLVPGFDDQPCGSLPMNQGLGFNTKGQRPHTRWQARYTPDFQPWLAAYPSATLDERVQKRIGPTYLHRFEQAEDNKAARQEWLDQLDAAEDGSNLPGLGSKKRPKPNKKEFGKTGGSGKVASLLSPSQRRQQDVSDTSAQSTATVDPTSLTSAEQRALELITAEPGHTPTSLAQALNISRQGAGKHLRSLASKNHVTQYDDGSYTAG